MNVSEPGSNNHGNKTHIVRKWFTLFWGFFWKAITYCLGGSTAKHCNQKAKRDGSEKEYNLSLFPLGPNSHSSCQKPVAVKPQGMPLKPLPSLQLTCAHVGVLPVLGLSSFSSSCIQSPPITRSRRLRVKTLHEGLHHSAHTGERRRRMEPPTSQHFSGSQLQVSPSSPWQFIPQVILRLMQWQRSPKSFGQKIMYKIDITTCPGHFLQGCPTALVSPWPPESAPPYAVHLWDLLCSPRFLH